MPTNNQSGYPSISLTAPQPEIVATAPAPVPPNPNNPPWGLGAALLVLVGSIVLQLGFSLLFFLPYLIHLSLRPDAPPNLVEFAASDKTAILLQVIAIFPSHLVSLALVWAIVTRFGKLPFSNSLGLKWYGYPWLLVSVAFGSVLFGAAAVLVWLLGGETPTQLDQIINSSLAARYVLAALAVFTAPLVEELIYRGVLYSALQRLVGISPAVIVVLVIFTLIHVPQYWPNVAVIAAVGFLSICLTIIRAHTGRLLPCVVIHLVFNAIQAVVLVIEPHLPKLAKPGEQAAGMLFRLGDLLS